MSINNIPILTLDYEATGIPEANPKITQVGFEKFVGGKISSYEFTIGGVVKKDKTKLDSISEDLLKWKEEVNHERASKGLPLLREDRLARIVTEEDYLQAHIESKAEDFGRTQYENGSFKPLVEDQKEKLLREVDAEVMGVSPTDIEISTDGDTTRGYTSFRRALGLLGQELHKDPSIVLIQNANYEREVTRRHIKQNSVLDFELDADINEGDIDRYRSSQGMTYSMKESMSKLFGSTDHLFKVSDHIENRRQTAYKAYQEVTTSARLNKGTPTPTVMKTFLNSQRRVYDEITTFASDNHQRGLSTTVDLMDITRTYQAELINAGYLDYRFFGKSMDMQTLASTFLDEDETHTALSDSVQQRKVFQELNKRIEDLKAGTSSASLHETYINKATHQDTVLGAYRKGLANAVQEAVVKATREAEVAKSNKSKYNYDEKLLVHVRSRVDKVTNRYKDLPEHPDVTRIGMAESVLNQIAGNIPDQPEASIPNPETPEVEPKTGGPSTTSTERATNVIKQLNAGNLSEVIVPEESVQKAATKNAITESIGTGKVNPLKIGLYGVSAMVALNLLAGDREKNKPPQQSSYDALYNNLYLGQGYADYMERNNSHKMIY